MIRDMPKFRSAQTHMILHKDGQGLIGRGGRKGQLAVTGERKGSGLSLSEAVFRRLGTCALMHFSCLHIVIAVLGLLNR